MNKKNYIKIICIFFTLFKTGEACDRSIFITNSDTLNPLGEKEIIVILQGLGGNGKKRRSIKNFFKNKGYDIFIPDYISRESVNECVNNLEKKLEQINIHEYKKVHFFTYILGSWTFNLYLKNHEMPNLTTIVYDRSPLQERAPYLASENLRLTSRMLTGKLIKDLGHIKYPPIQKKDINVGIIIENGSTLLIRMFKKKALKMGPVYWQADSLHQEYNDFFHTWLNHNQMYGKVNVIGEEILYFIAKGSFSPDARKSSYKGDPFSKKKAD